MAILSDIEIAQQCEMKPIQEIARAAHVPEEDLPRWIRRCCGKPTASPES